MSTSDELYIINSKDDTYSTLDMEIVEQDGVKKKSKTIIQQGPTERLNNMRSSQAKDEKLLEKVKARIKERAPKIKKLAKLLEEIDNI